MESPTQALITVAVGLATLRFIKSIYRHWVYSGIPSVGHGGMITSYLTAFQYLKEANVVLLEGYRKYKGRIFKVAQVDSWLLIVSGDRLIEELRNAPEDVLSEENAMADLLQSDYTLGKQLRENTYHTSVIRTSLNRKLANILPDEIDELRAAFRDEIDLKLVNEGWTGLKATDIFTQIITRISNRVFVGLPLCRNEAYCRLNIDYAMHVMFGAFIINAFPPFLKSIVGWVFNAISGDRRKAAKFLGPMIEERRAKISQFGKDYPDKPDDLLSWIMDAAPPGPMSSMEGIASRMLFMNFSALHTTAMSFVHALYHLASKLEYVEPLREEILEHLGPNPSNWTKAALEKCWKLDSFLKECQRLNGLGALSLPRKAMRTYVFNDGTEVPQGAIVSATQTATQLDDAYYEHAEKFDGFRFSKLREKVADQEKQDIHEETGEALEEDWKYRYTGTGIGFLAFGGGRHVCPGRFFASSTLKCMIAYLLLKYDIKIAGDGKRPADIWFGPACIPSRSAEVLFKRRDALL
ncbi:hypothetical protein QCA50_016079 [Cerrena zonata]|uniref:Cytochrome P450 n=1 Tax=Cerrena zonata TaxID=2478898 RepID=A0AAW0FJ51_9APHY